MNIIIQQTTQKDFFQTEYLTRESFWNIYRPGCTEHLVLHRLRNSAAYIKELDLIALQDGEIVGHIISTRARVMDAQELGREILCVGPLAVLPALQKKGIGAMLMNESIKRAREMGFAGLILFGRPEYYHRFGFRNAKAFGITTKEGQNFEPFMALELQKDGLSEVKGRFFEDPSFEPPAEELEEFEKKFPYREKMKTDTQLE